MNQTIYNKFNGAPAKFRGTRRVTVNVLASFADGLVTQDTTQLDRMRQGTEGQLTALGWSVAYCTVIPFDSGYVYAIVLGLNVDTVFPANDIRNNLIRDLQANGLWRNVNINSLNDPQTYSYGTTSPSGSGTYTVVRGDTLNAIARRFNMTLAQILALNPQITNANVISVGQVIRVSGTASPVTTPTNTTGGSTAVNNVLQAITGSTPSGTAKEKNWFDRTFFTGAGALSGIAIGTLVVLGAIVITKGR